MIQISSALFITMVVVGGGCEREPKAVSRFEHVDAAIGAEQPAGSMHDPSQAGQAVEDSEANPAETTVAADQLPSNGTEPEIEAQDGDTVLLRAVGRARSTADIDIARQAAASRARKKLHRLLARRGIHAGSEEGLPETTIEKYYKKGKYVYAVARCEVPARKPVNVSGGAASKAPVNETGQSEGKPPSGPQGGRK